MIGDEAAEPAWHRPPLKPASILAILAVLAGACAVSAQPVGKRIGMLVSGPPPGEHICVQEFRRGLGELGWVEGRTHVLEVRWVDKGKPEEAFPRFVADLVKLGADVIVSVTAQGLSEARDAIGAVPVVMAASNYAVERGLISSLNRPGGNITGLATFTGELHAKRLQLLSEALPGLSRVTVLRVTGDQSDLILRDLEKTARLLGLKLQVIEVKRTEDFPAAFQAAARDRTQAVMTTQGPFFYQNMRLIAELALEYRLPSLSGEPMAAEAGMLMTHGANRIADSCHRAASFADRILKGAKPGDLPVEQVTRYELVVNLKTARSLGLTLPPAILLRADRVIE
jgi:putative ABC transport system substrate-binding protein